MQSKQNKATHMSMSNTRKIYLFSFFWMFLVIMPVIVPFLLNLGLSMHQVFQLQAIFGISVVALEVPTGYLCDLWGRKQTLIIGSFISGLAFTLIALGSIFVGFFFLSLVPLMIAIHKASPDYIPEG